MHCSSKLVVVMIVGNEVPASGIGSPMLAVKSSKSYYDLLAEVLLHLKVKCTSIDRFAVQNTGILCVSRSICGFIFTQSLSAQVKYRLRHLQDSQVNQLVLSSWRLCELFRAI